MTATIHHATARAGLPQPTAHLSRRRFAAGAGVGLLAAAGLGRRSVARAGATPAASGYPRTIIDALGEVTIGTRPERVFVPDPAFNLDALLYLGLRPALVGTPALDDAYAAWCPLSYQDGADGLPNLEMGPTGPSIEALRAARVDLSVIIGDYADWYLGEADLRRAGAPVVALPNDDPAAQLRILGAALALESRAEAGAGEVAAMFAGYRPPRIPTSIKAFNGETDGTFYLLQPDDTVSRLLERLGLPPLSVPETVADQLGAGVPLSSEAIPELEADLLIGFEFEDGLTGTAAVEASPLFARLAVVREGRYLRCQRDQSWALSYPSVLSLPLAMATLTEALGG